MDEQVDIENNIWLACSDNDIEGVKAFLASGVSVNSQDENGYSPIAAAVSYNNIELVKFLLSQGADKNIKDPDGDMPIHFCETAEMFEFLVANGFDPMAKNFAGEGIFDKAVDDENEEFVTYLINRGLGGPVQFNAEFKDEYNPDDYKDEEDDE